MKASYICQRQSADKQYSDNAVPFMCHLAANFLPTFNLD